MFEEVIPSLDCALEGYNATIFTYGQTGTGKTHTILGHDLWEMAYEMPSDTMTIKEQIVKDERRNGIIPRRYE